MKYILKHIKSLICTQTLFFILLILSVFGSSVIMLFSFGVYHNFRMKTADFTDAERNLDFSFSEKDDNNEPFPLGAVQEELRGCIEMLDGLGALQGTELIAVNYYDPALKLKVGVMSRFLVQNGIYTVYSELEKNLIQSGTCKSGRFYTPDEYARGDSVVLAAESELNAEGRMLLFGQEFEPVMILSPYTFSDVPFPAVPGDASLLSMTVMYERPPAAQTVNTLMETVAQTFGDRVILPEFDAITQEQYYFYRTILVIALLIAAAAAVNLVILYHYIFLRRTKTMAVYMLCGCTKQRAVLLYFGEILLLTLPLFLLSALLFHFGIMPLFAHSMPYLAEAYSVKLYAAALLMYLAVCAAGVWMLTQTVIANSSARAVYSESC